MTAIYRFRVGKFDCLAINDGEVAGNAVLLFANAPEDALAAALDAHGERADAIPSTWTCLLVNTGAKRVLIDTGVGQAGNRGGQLLPALAAHGIAPEEIDVVILPHVHGDHVLGAVTEDGAPTFPNATYVMGKSEWNYWTNPDTLAQAPQWAAKTAQGVLPTLQSRMRTIAVPGDVVEGIRLVPAFGHTHGHAVVEITSDGEQLLYLADTALHPIHFEHPDWFAAVDQYPEQTVQTRRTLFERASEQNALVLLFHFTPFPSLGYIVAEGSGWRWQRAEAHIIEEAP